jgi:lysozyme
MNQANKWLVGVVAAVTITAVATFEGKSNDPYLDLANIWTVCYGQTHVEMRHYADAECKGMLSASLVKYGDSILQCINVPVTQNQHAAFTSLSYNIGVEAFCKSTLVKKLNQGDYRGACDGLMRWVYVNGKFVQGLANRREVEREICLKEIV